MTYDGARSLDTLPAGPGGFRTLVCADWAGPIKKRRAYAADLAAREVHSLGPGPWTLETLLADGEALAANGPVLVALDLPLGVPAGYLGAARGSAVFAGAQCFLDLLARACQVPRYFEPTSDPADWRVERPFFAVPRRGLLAYESAIALRGASARRAVDIQTGAKPIFAKSGIPGSVGTGTIDVWRALGPLLKPARIFTVWPFEGRLTELAARSKLVLAEIYPRAAYATALLGEAARDRPRASIGKRHACCRAWCVGKLLRASWIQQHGVTLRDTEEAVASEDSFDALLTAAALLRCAVEGWPAAEIGPGPLDPEGAILATGTVEFSMNERRLGCADEPRKRGMHAPRNGRVRTAVVGGV